MIRSEPYGQKTFFLLSIVSLAAFAAAALTEIYVLALAPFLIILFYLGWNNFLAIYLLLLFTLPFSIEYSFSDSLSTDIPDEGLMWLVSLLALIHVANKEVSLASKLRHPLVYLLGLHLAWILLTIVFSSNHLLSLKFFLAKSWYIISFLIAPLILLNDKRRIRLAAMVLLGSILLAMLIILVRHAFLGFSFASINEAAEWFFRNHVNYSAMLVCAFPMLLAFYLLSTSTSKRKFIVIVSLVTLVALYFTYARGAWLALAAGGVSWWLIRKKWLVQSWLLAIVFALLMIFWLKSDNRYLRYAHDFNTTIFHENFQQHLIATYQLKDVSTAERFYRWIAGIRMIGDKPLTGFGPSTFYQEYKPYTIPAYKTWVSDNRERSTVHNYFLLVAIEQGIPGLVFYLLLLTVMLFYAQRLYHRIEDIFYRTVVLCCGITIVMITVINLLSDMIETDKVGPFFFLSLALLMISDFKNRKSEFTPDI